MLQTLIAMKQKLRRCFSKFSSSQPLVTFLWWMETCCKFFNSNVEVRLRLISQIAQQFPLSSTICYENYPENWWSWKKRVKQQSLHSRQFLSIVVLSLFHFLSFELHKLLVSFSETELKTMEKGKEKNHDDDNANENSLLLMKVLWIWEEFEVEMNWNWNRTWDGKMISRQTKRSHQSKARFSLNAREKFFFN